MSLLPTVDGVGTVLVTPGPNDIIPPNQQAQAISNEAASPLSVALGGASNASAGSTISQFYNASPVKTFMLIGGLYLMWKFRRRLI